MAKKKDRDIEKGYSVKQMVAITLKGGEDVLPFKKSWDL